MIWKSTIADPHSRFGSRHEATSHFIAQRLTGAANVLFVLFFVWFVVRLAGAGRDQMVEQVRNPIVALLLALLIINVCVHMRIGMREIIEDYLDEARTNGLALMLNTMFALFVAGVALVSIGKIVFWG